MPGTLPVNMIQTIESNASKHPLPKNPAQYSYGTAGFRMKADLLDPVFYRVGLLAALRSKFWKGKTVGVMITASHNPAEDNGVKVVDPMGDMLEEAWEQWACQLANTTTVGALVQKIVDTYHIDLHSPANVVVGRDTRPSGVALTQSLFHGLEALGANAKDMGLLTTPQLHYITRCSNDPSFGEPSEMGYYTKLARAFKQLVPTSTSPMRVVVDCANGVGAIALQALAPLLAPQLTFTLTHTQTDQPSLINTHCGADYVKTQQRAPDPLEPKTLYASLDGDADRVVFYYANPDFRLLDGDKIACLLAGCFLSMPRNVGVVQTAYANGSSTQYLNALGIPVVCTHTGVKHLHHEALKFETGIYFEANGHGTVLFQHPVEGYSDLVNQTVGDAISDLLLVLVMLQTRSVEQWDQLYSDLPNQLWKVQVDRREAFTTTDADRRLVTPSGLQARIDQAMAKVKGRAFVRPSGTENVVRVYAEAPTPDACAWLGNTVAGLVFIPLCIGNKFVPKLSRRE